MKPPTPFQRSAEHPLGSNRQTWQLAEPVLGAPSRGWVLYDGDCPLCCAAAARFAPLLQRHGFQFAPLQTPWVQAQLGLQPNVLLNEMKLLTADGNVFGGAEAVVQIARAIWWGWPLFALAQIPGVKHLLATIYRHVAANRHCLSRVCFKQKPATKRHTTFLEMP